MAEHSAVNRRVVGSSPTWGVFYYDLILWRICQRVFCTHSLGFRLRGLSSEVDNLLILSFRFYLRNCINHQFHCIF